MKNDQLLSTHDAAKILGKSSESVRLYHKQGKLTALRTASGQRLFRESQVRLLAATQARKTTKHAESAE